MLLYLRIWTREKLASTLSPESPESWTRGGQTRGRHQGVEVSLISEVSFFAIKHATASKSWEVVSRNALVFLPVMPASAVSRVPQVPPDATPTLRFIRLAFPNFSCS